MYFLKNSSNLFIITAIAYFSGLTNILSLELLSYSFLSFFLIKSTRKYWISNEGLFVIFFSLITLPFIIGDPNTIFNHFKQLILTLSILTFSLNLKPLSIKFLSIISLINFIIVFLQNSFGILLIPEIFIRGNYMKSMYEAGLGMRAVGILVGSHPSTSLIALASLALFYANKESFKLLINGKLSKNNIFILFLLTLNILSIYFSYTYTALIALFFQFCVIFGNRLFFIKIFKNNFKKIYLNFSGFRINYFLIFFLLILILVFLNIDKIEKNIFSIFSIFLDNRGIASLGIIIAQFKSILNIAFDIPIFPYGDAVVNTNLSEEVQGIFALSESSELGLEIGYFKIIYKHGLVMGIYLLALLFRKLYGLRTFMFFGFLHYAHITTNPLILIMAITVSKYAKINSKEITNNLD